MIRLIAAVDRRGGIAKKGVQPWYLPEDENYFASQTKSHGGHILVGSTTYRTFQGPLPERTNYVLSRHEEALAGAELVHDLEDFLQHHSEDLWVIGGANVYAQIMDADLADELYLTHIEADFGCDQFFPAWDAYRPHTKTALREQNGFLFSYTVYTRAA